MKIKSVFMAAIVAAALLVALPVTAADQININTATIEQLQEIKGFGPKTAEAIVAYRQANGAFMSVDDLVNVKGIGKKTLERVKDSLTIGKQDAEATDVSAAGDGEG